MKKKIMAILCLLIVLFSANAYASELNVTEYLPIETEVTDDNIREAFLESTFVRKEGENAYIFESEYQPTALLKSGMECQTNTTITIVCESEEDIELLEALRAGVSYSTYAEAWDSTGGIKAYTTVYYKDENDSNGKTWRLVTKVTGGYTKADNSLSVTSQTLVCGCSNVGTTQSVTKYPTSSSWSYDMPTSWVSIKLATPNWYATGCTYTLTIKRASTPWTLTLQNNPK